MRSLPVILTLLAVALSAFADGPDGDAKSQVRAAQRDAVVSLMDEVSRTPLTRALSVGEFVRRTNSADELNKVLQRAQQVGGPRWINEHTCQVELQISGPVVAAALKRIAAASPRQSPLPPREVDRAVKDWDERSFNAIGAATSRLPVVNVNAQARPPRLQRDPWWDVPQNLRDQAVASAKADAAHRALSRLESIPLTGRSTVGDALAVKGVGDRLQEWLVAQPAARVELTEDMEARVELGTTAAESFAEFRSLASRVRDLPLPQDDKEWARVRDDFERRSVMAVGRAVVAPAGGAAAVNAGVPKPLALPARAPRWVDRRLEASGSGGPAQSKLMAARAAETAAEEKIRRQIEDLELTQKTTVGQAAKDDPRVDQAIRRALAHTHIGKADYHANGAADINVYLDLADLWQELQDAQ
jgi:hypothetical protein